MKQLYLLRHAKSSREAHDGADFDRPLAKRGRLAARLVDAYCRGQGIAAGLVLCSPSRRTRETLELLPATVGRNTRVRFEPALYLAEAADLLAELRTAPDDEDSILLIGHNPGLQELGLALAKQPQSLRKRLAEKFPTAALACLDADLDHWAELRPGACVLRCYVTPAELPA